MSGHKLKLSILPIERLLCLTTPTRSFCSQLGLQSYFTKFTNAAARSLEFCSICSISVISRRTCLTQYTALMSKASGGATWLSALTAAC